MPRACAPVESLAREEPRPHVRPRALAGGGLEKACLGPDVPAFRRLLARQAEAEQGGASFPDLQGPTSADAGAYEEPPPPWNRLKRDHSIPQAGTRRMRQIALRYLTVPTASGQNTKRV